MVVYVDGILSTGNNHTTIESLKEHLNFAFGIKDLGSLHFLGMEASYSNKGIILTQEKFTKELISNSGFTDFKKVLTPLPTNLRFSAFEGTPISDPSLRRNLVGNILTSLQIQGLIYPILFRH